MEDVLAILERWRPGVTATFVPATDDAFDELHALAGELPAAYERFLRTMGRSSGALDLRLDGEDVRFDLPAVMDERAQLGWMNPFLLVGVVGAGAPHVYLDREHDGMVVRLVPGQEAHRIRLHTGMDELVVHQAFRALRLPQLACVRHLQARGRDTRLVDAVAAELGLARLSPPSSHSPVYDRGDAALLVHRRPAASVVDCVLAADDAGELERLADALARA